MFDTEQLIKAGKACLKLEIFKAVLWAIAAGVAFGCIMIKPGEGFVLAAKLICLMVNSGCAAVNAKEAVRSMRMLHQLESGKVRVEEILGEILKEHEEETKE